MRRSIGISNDRHPRGQIAADRRNAARDRAPHPTGTLDLRVHKRATGRHDRHMSKKAADRKKRGVNQRTGRKGESFFEYFASCHYLVPSKADEDVGVDFLCLVEETTSAETREISGHVLGAAVRSTEAKRPRVKMNRADADLLLRARYPVCFILVDLTQELPQIHHRFLDEAFATELAQFLNSAEESHIVTPKRCRDEADFDDDLRAALAGGRPEQVRLALATARLAAHILEPTLEITRTADGELTIVQSSDFYSFFTGDSRTDNDQVHAAIFGRPDLRLERLARLGPTHEVIRTIKDLPAPILTGLTGEETVALVAQNTTGHAAARFDSLRTGHLRGWVHSAGLSLTVSDPILRGDTYVHEIKARVDEAAGDVGQADDLWRFLEYCTEDGSFYPENSPNRALPASYVNGLRPINSYAVWMRLAEQIPGWSSTALPLKFATDDESLHGLALLAQMADSPKFIENFGFVIEVGGAQPQFEEYDEEAELPFVANMGERATIIWMRVTQTAFVHAGQCHGIKIQTVHSVRVDFEDRQHKATPYPELVIDNTWPTIAFDPGPTQTTSDARQWPVHATTAITNSK